MSDINRETEALLKQMREMRLTPDELDEVREKYKGSATRAEVIIHTAATLLALEITFAGGDLPPTRHSLLGPSGANRWLKCSAAPLLSEGVAEVRDKRDAAQGTAAHAIIAKRINV